MRKGVWGWVQWVATQSKEEEGEDESGVPWGKNKTNKKMKKRK